ncbi:universal stress protein [Haloarcula marina]|uniref:universal stress protein n=1 Tax=Haloarcula marina TaxID=2961574 RepID=UPI0020B6CEAB|nr:universal stress protein [Halomicroarcula marina]
MTILVAVADDTISAPVIDTAIRLGEGLGQELYVVHLLEEEVADSEAKHVRDRLRERFADETVVATVALEYVGRTRTRSGPRIAAELLELAADVDITQIVMGHEPKGLAGRLTAGDVAFAVVDAADVPVTIVPTS